VTGAPTPPRTTEAGRLAELRKRHEFDPPMTTNCDVCFVLSELTVADERFRHYRDLLAEATAAPPLLDERSVALVLASMYHTPVGEVTDEVLASARMFVRRYGLPQPRPIEDRCDRIVNSGVSEPTECGRTLPCEHHR
jgi:hypothetical protein